MLKTKFKPKIPKLKGNRDNYSRKLKQKILIKYLLSEFRSSTTHGLPHIVNNKIHWLERVFWTISFGLCVALTFILISAQYYRLIEAPIVMSVEMDYYNWNISFPAITLCPIFKTDQALLDAYVKHTRNVTEPNLDFYFKVIGLARLDTMDNLDIPNPELLQHIEPEEYTTIAFSLFKRFNTDVVSTGIDVPVAMEPVMTEMGMCHAINSNTAVFDNPEKWGDTKLAAAKNSILLTVHDQDFFTLIQNYTNIYKVYVTSPDEVILSTTSSYYFTQDGSLSFGVQIWSTRVSENIRLVPLHLRKCRFKDEPTSKRYPIYSYNRCLLDCRIKMLNKLCGCIPHIYKPIDDERICHMIEIKQCLLIYKKEILTLTTSSDTLTASFEEVGNIDHLPTNPRACNCYSNCDIDMYQREHEMFIPKSGINRLRISVSTFPKVRIVREVIFSLFDFLLRCGGVVNLCIGTSIISIVELLSTILRIQIYSFILVLRFLYRRLKTTIYFNKK